MAQLFLNWIINLQPAGFTKLQIGGAVLGVMFILLLLAIAIGFFVYRWVHDLREAAEAEACAEKWHQEFNGSDKPQPKSPLRECAAEFAQFEKSIIDQMAKGLEIDPTELTKSMPIPPQKRKNYGNKVMAKIVFEDAEIHNAFLFEKGDAIIYGTLTKKQVQYRLRKIFSNYPAIKQHLVFKKSRVVLGGDVISVVLMQ